MSYTPGVPTYGDYQASLDEFLSVKRQIDQLQERLELLKPRLVEAISIQGGKVIHDGCEVCVRTRTTYNYSEVVRIAAIALKEMKRAEQQGGLATIKTHREFLQVRSLQPAA